MYVTYFCSDYVRVDIHCVLKEGKSEIMGLSDGQEIMILNFDLLIAKSSEAQIASLL